MEEMTFDLCIIGAGFFGSSAARYASANPNLKICLIGLDEPSEEELEKREIFSSHYDEGRIVKVLFASPAYQELSKQSIKCFRHLEKISGIKFYNPVGFMNVGKKGSHLMKNLEDVSSAVGTTLFDLSDQVFLNRIFPFIRLKHDEYGLLDNTGAGIISARKILAAERKVANEQGCLILYDAVKHVGGLKNSYHVVETAHHGEIKAKRILFTTGAFTNVNRFKILPQLETYVYKEMATLVRIPDKEVLRLSTMPGIIYKRDEDDDGSYILPPVHYPDGKFYLKVGSMAYDFGEGLQSTEEIKEWFTSEEITGETHLMSRPLFEALPGLVSEGLFRKICVTCETPTGFPYIDNISPTVTLAVAGNGWGATTAGEIGRLAAHLSLTGQWDSKVPKSLFDIVLKKA